MVSKGKTHHIQDLGALIAWNGDTRVGAATYHMGQQDCELLSINATVEGLGVGTALLTALEQMVRQTGLRRVWLITSNDNLDALRFYQRRGYRIVAVYPNAIDEARKIKPSIPMVGYYDIPIHDELELEKWL
jgi:ribosomal protein S18 acetylase RimI-like enzyme